MFTLTCQRVALSTCPDSLARHAGHADIVRELVDSPIGYSADISGIPNHDQA